jgi:uncharacterized membrane protein YhiD involved in acid resistance
MSLEPESAKPNKKRLLISFFKNVIIAIIIVVFFYFAYNFFLQNKNSKSSKTSQEEDLFFLSEDAHKNVNLDELNFAEIKEKGPEFVYQLLVKNQVQIQDLYNKIKDLNNELIKYQNRQQISKIAISYFELHQKIFNSTTVSVQDIVQHITTLELLLTESPDLQGNIDIIKSALPNFINQNILILNLQKIIPHFKALQQKNIEPNFFDKIKINMAKFITFRKIKNAPEDSIDYKINQLELAIKQQNYTLALQIFLSLNQSENQEMTNFYYNLKAIQQIEKADLEIMKIIKNLI